MNTRKTFFAYKILAIGYKRFMWIKDCQNHEYCVRINDTIYDMLRAWGVPTSQYLKHHEN